MEWKQNLIPYNILVVCISAFNDFTFAYHKSACSDFNDNFLEYLVWIVWLENQ